MTSISWRRWEESRTVPPRSAYPRRRSRIQRMPAGSSPFAGSSRMSTCGSPSRARADAEALAHPQGVVPDPPVGLVGGEADQVEHLLDPGPGQAHGALGEGEDLPTGAPGVLRGGVQEDAHLGAGVGQVGEPAPVDR